MRMGLRPRAYLAGDQTTRGYSELYPESANVWDSLGDALDSAGKKDEALTSYRKAVSLAEANGDPNLEHFKKQAARLAVATKPGGR